MAVSTTYQFMHNQNPWRSSVFFDCLPILHESTCVIDAISHPYLLAKQLVDSFLVQDKNGTLEPEELFPMAGSLVIQMDVELPSTPTIHGSSAVSLLSL